MMQWWSQRFAAEGSASAEGLAKQLGRPETDPLTILVRETAQNSWDAHEDDVVDVRFELQRVGDRSDVWREHLVPGLGPEAGIDLEHALRPDAYVLVVGDRGTRGLGGPLRADRKPAPGESPDFVQFLRNVGEARDQQHGGGTYGFGKGILYSCSAAGAIVVDTHARHASGVPRRLMGAALGRSFHDTAGTRFTGRHWWGQVVDDVPDPAQGADADNLARRLGLRGFGPQEFGTDIVVLDVRLGHHAGDDSPERTPGEAGAFLASSVLWHLWPKMGSAERAATMRFEVLVDGIAVELPEPSEVPELRPFVESLDAIHRGEGNTYSRTVPPRDAGTSALRPCPAPRTGAARPVVEAAQPFTGTPHHVCRMRVPELVVDYLPTTPHPDPLLGYGGVFKASAAADELFAQAEPPTHDKWVSAGLTGAARGVVTNLGRHLESGVAEQFSRASTGLQVSVEGLGRLAGELAILIPSIRGTGAGVQSDPSSPGRSRGVRGGGGRRARITAGPAVQLREDGPVVVTVVEIDPGEEDLWLQATAEIVLAGGGAEKDDGRPLGAGQPEVLGWVGPDGVTRPGRELQGGSEISGTWEVLARHLPDAAVQVTIRKEKNDA